MRGLHILVSVCVTHYTGPTIWASNYTLTLSWPSVMPGPWSASQAALFVSLAPCYLSQAALWAYSMYSGTGGGTPPGHNQFLRPRNLCYISIINPWSFITLQARKLMACYGQHNTFVWYESFRWFCNASGPLDVPLRGPLGIGNSFYHASW